MIQGIFYARFFPQQGTQIVAQSPPGCLVPSPSSPKPPLLDFAVLQEYIIPRKAFYNRYVTVQDPSNRHAVLGFPVSIASPRYDRNEFIFNFGLVIPSDVEDRVPYERVVRRLAETFAEMERQAGYLSGLEGLRLRAAAGEDSGFFDKYCGDHVASDVADSTPPRPIASLLEIIKEDLNNYGECMIPVEPANTINMKLFPHHPSPPAVRGWHVPVAKMQFSDVVDPTWDLTLQKVVAHIDGVADVRRIAAAAHVSLPLCQLALRHLLYYDTILLLDMFLFGACYAPRPGIANFVANADGIVEECAQYVCVCGASGGRTGQQGSALRSASAAAVSDPAISVNEPAANSDSEEVTAHLLSDVRVPNYTLIKLMTTFCVGRTVLEWLHLHADAGLDVLQLVDVRRLVQFGVINGFLYRVHKYAVRLDEGDRDGALSGYLDGRHCFDQIMTETNLTDAELMERLKGFGAPTGVAVLYR